MEDVFRSDAMRLYLKEMGQTPLLAPKEEVVLAKRIKRGDKVARTKMVKANLRLVVKIAHDFDGLGLPLLDLISEGNIGLMKAVDRFDPQKGAKLSTYAAWWIKQTIRRALADKTRTIRIPVHLVNKMVRMRRAIHELTEIMGREPSDEEIAKEIDMTVRLVQHMKILSVHPASLNQPVADDESTELGEIIEDPSAIDPGRALLDKNMRRVVQNVLTQLEEREAQILILRFGLRGGRAQTLEEVGKKFKVTRERVRQIQNVALQKIRKLIEADKVRGV